MRLAWSCLLFSAALWGQTEKDWINLGIQAFKNGQFREAAANFQNAVDLNPGNVTARLYLGTSYLQMYIPGAETPENLATADRAQAEFERILQSDPANKVALASEASLLLNRKRFDDARAAYQRLAAVDPNSPIPYYSMAFCTWAQWYPVYGQARTSLGMRPETPGPIPDASTRNALHAQWWSKIDAAIANLNRALELDPMYDDAMAYMNLFIRERADLAESKAEYTSGINEADDWVRKALDTKRMKAGRQQGGAFAGPVPPPPPPPPPPPSSSGGSSGATPQRIRVGSNVQAAKLVSGPTPVYPPLARQAQVQGVVRLAAIIGKDGNVQHLEVLNGHPLLVPAAIEAVKVRQYQPTLLNGQPVEVYTEIEVPFTLGQ